MRVRGFRTLRDARFRPGAIAAIVGEPSTGKSNLLAAIWALLDPEAARSRPGDVCRDDGSAIRIEGRLGDGASRSPSRSSRTCAGTPATSRRPVLPVTAPQPTRWSPHPERGPPPPGGIDRPGRRGADRRPAAAPIPPPAGSSSVSRSGRRPGRRCDRPDRGARAVPPAAGPALPVPAAPWQSRPPGTRSCTRRTPRRC